MVSGIKCVNDHCQFAKYPNLGNQLIETNNNPEYIITWANQHIKLCEGPVFINLTDGYLDIITQSGTKKIAVGR